MNSMEQTQEHPQHPPFGFARNWRKSLLGMAQLEMTGGLVGIILAVVGLAGIRPLDLAAIAAMIIGVDLFLEGIAFGSRYQRLSGGSSGPGMRVEKLTAGMTAQFLGGAVGATLGLLALLEVAPFSLISVAVILFGTASLVSVLTGWQLNSLDITSRGADEPSTELARIMVSVVACVQAIASFAVMTLGILSLVRYDAAGLALVALLCLSASNLLNGASIGTRVMGMGRSY